MISNNGRAETFERCPREYFHSYEIFGTGLVGFYTEDFFADGIAMHAGLASLYGGQGINEAVSKIDEEYARLSTDPDVPSRVAWSQRMLTTYAGREEPVDDFETLEVESDFRVTLGEQCWNCSHTYGTLPNDVTTCPRCGVSLHWWVGRTDVNCWRHGGFKVLDHKTTKGTANANYIASFDHSFQLIGYAYGISKQNERKVTGYGVNVLKKLERVEPYTVSCKNCRGTGQLKTRGCSKCGGSGVITKEPAQLFVRKWFNYTADKKQKFITTRTSTLNQIEEQRKLYKDPRTRPYSFPMCAKACHTMRSGGGCKFIDLCWNPTNPAHKWDEPSDALLSTKYKQRRADYVNLMEEELD